MSRVMTIQKNYFFIFYLVGKGGNASCTVAPLGAVCGTPGRLAFGSIARWTVCRPDLPTKNPLCR